MNHAIVGTYCDTHLCVRVCTRYILLPQVYTKYNHFSSSIYTCVHDAHLRQRVCARYIPKVKFVLGTPFLCHRQEWLVCTKYIPGNCFFIIWYLISLLSEG